MRRIIGYACAIETRESRDILAAMSQGKSLDEIAKSIEASRADTELLISLLGIAPVFIKDGKICKGDKILGVACESRVVDDESGTEVSLAQTPHEMLAVVPPKKSFAPTEEATEKPEGPQKRFLRYGIDNVKDFLREHSTNDLALELGMGVSSASRLCLKYGISAKAIWEERKERNKSTDNTYVIKDKRGVVTFRLSKADLVEARKSLSVREIADTLGCEVRSIWSASRHFGLKADDNSVSPSVQIDIPTPAGSVGAHKPTLVYRVDGRSSVTHCAQV